MNHLTAADRGRIEVLLELKYSKIKIARLLGRHKSTITREIQKCTSNNSTYVADYAEIVSHDRHSHSYNQPKLTKHSDLGNYVIDRIKAGWDPAQIAGRLKLTGAYPRVCSETIYAWVYNSPTNRSSNLYQYLRYGKKQRGWQHTAQRTRQCFKLPNRVSIHQRPDVVSQRTRLGDWEGDTVAYPACYRIISAYERTSSYALLAKVPDKRAKTVCPKLGAMLASTISPKTITLDNGVEFYHHHEISRLSGVAVYFADIYASNQRGGNENLNRQLRAYLPKQTNIASLTDIELTDIQDELNQKPRQRLNWRTPQEVYGWLAEHPDNLLDLDKVAFESRS